MMMMFTLQLSTFAKRQCSDALNAVFQRRMASKTTVSSRFWLTRQARDPYVRQAHEEGYRARSAFKLLQLNEGNRIIKQGDRVVDLGAAPGGWTQVAIEACGATCAPTEAVEAMKADGMMPASSCKAGRAAVLHVPAAPRRVSILSLSHLESAAVGPQWTPPAHRTNPNRTPQAGPVPPASSFMPNVRGPLVVAVDLQRMDPLRGAQLVLGDCTLPHVQAAVRALLGVQGTGGQGQADVVLSDMAPRFTGEGGTDHTRNLALAWRALLTAEDVLRADGRVAIKVRHGEQYTAFRAAMGRRFREVREEKPGASRAESAETYLVGLGYDPEGAAGRPASAEEAHWMQQLGL